MNSIEYALWRAKQHANTAREAISMGWPDLIDYSISEAERNVLVAEEMLERSQNENIPVDEVSWPMVDA